MYISSTYCVYTLYILHKYISTQSSENNQIQFKDQIIQYLVY